MGNKESVTITHQKADHDGIQMKKDEANGHALSGLDLTDAVTCETSMPKKSEPPTVTVTKNIKPTPASVQANGIPKKAAVTVEAAGNHVSDITVSAESDTPTKDTTKQPEISSVFNKMFKKKAELVSPASEANVPDDQPINPASVEANGTQSADGHVSAITVSAEPSTPTKDSPKQPEISSMFNKMFKKKAESVSPPSEANVAAEKSISSAENPASVSVEVNGTQSKAAVSVEAAGNQISATTVSTDSNKTAKDTPKQPEISSMFNKMFKKKTEPISPALEANVATEELIASAIEPQSQKCNPASASTDVNNTRVKTALSMEAASIRVSAEIPSEDNPPAKDSPKQPEMSSMFNKMFKKKPEPVSPASEANVVADEPISSAAGTKSQKSEPTAIKANTQAEKVPQGEASSPSTTAVTPDVSTRPEQNSSEEKPVMNFFKTFVSSTKTTKEATASPDVSKEQEASKIPPPPPPAPPKMETKAEQAVKKDEAPPVQAAASAAKEPETSSKTKTKKDSFNKLFRPKSVVKEEAKPVETQVDASKTSTLEAGAKAEPPPAPKAEDKKATKKSSSFANLLKPKSTAPKKEAPTVATAPAEASASTKAKDEPKPASPAAPAAASPDNKSLGSTDNSSPSTSRKLEKRNSIQLFFKNLGQKRHSDAGVQTEASAPEKAK